MGFILTFKSLTLVKLKEDRIIKLTILKDFTFRPVRPFPPRPVRPFPPPIDDCLPLQPDFSGAFESPIPPYLIPPGSRTAVPVTGLRMYLCWK